MRGKSIRLVVAFGLIVGPLVFSVAPASAASMTPSSAPAGSPAASAAYQAQVYPLQLGGLTCAASCSGVHGVTVANVSLYFTGATPSFSNEYVQYQVSGTVGDLALIEGSSCADYETTCASQSQTIDRHTIGTSGEWASQSVGTYGSSTALYWGQANWYLGALDLTNTDAEDAYQTTFPAAGAVPLAPAGAIGTSCSTDPTGCNESGGGTGAVSSAPARADDCVPSGWGWLSPAALVRGMGCLLQYLFVPSGSAISGTWNTFSQEFGGSALGVPAKVVGNLSDAIQGFNDGVTVGGVTNMNCGSVLVPNVNLGAPPGAPGNGVQTGIIDPLGACGPNHKASPFVALSTWVYYGLAVGMWVGVAFMLIRMVAGAFGVEAPVSWAGEQMELFSVGGGK